MTKEEILAMKPGIELNKAVAERILGHTVKEDEIFGYMERMTYSKGSNDSCGCTTSCVTPVEGDSVWDSLEKYSEDNQAARVVVDKMLAIGYNDANSWADFGDGKFTEAEAICKAALIAVL